MAAPSTYAQFELGNTTYTSLVAIQWLPGAPQFLVHTVPNSVTHPSKFMGRGPASLEGVLQTTSANERAFITALQTETIRHAAWVDTDATAVYCHVYAGEVTSRELLNPYGAPANTKTVRIGFKFTCPDQRLYKYSDNSVLIGS